VCGTGGVNQNYVLELLAVLYISPNDYSTSQQLLLVIKHKGNIVWLKQFLVDKLKTFENRLDRT
jgi:hypothetical protein